MIYLTYNRIVFFDILALHAVMIKQTKQNMHEQITNLVVPRTQQEAQTWTSVVEEQHI